MKYTRKKLIEICKKSFVPKKKWNGENSYHLQIGVGVCLSLLATDCKFEVLYGYSHHGIRTNESTIWIKFQPPTCNCSSNYHSVNCAYSIFDSETAFIYYLPTEKRLKEANGADWS